MPRLAIAPTLPALLAVSRFAAQTEPKPPYSPPPSSAVVLKGISFSFGTPAGDQLRKRFTDYDSKDTCEGMPLKYGCSKDPKPYYAAMLSFDGKMGVDADGSP